jgi:RNase H-fold protein (predicted Holliday junction resolvase)
MRFSGANCSSWSRKSNAVDVEVEQQNERKKKQHASRGVYSGAKKKKKKKRKKDTHAARMYNWHVYLHENDRSNA